MKKPTCPSCQSPVSGKELLKQKQLRNFCNCPSCGIKIVVDRHTKRRQLIGIALALMALGLTVSMYFRGLRWLLPSIISIVILGAYIYSANKKVYYELYKSDT